MGALSPLWLSLRYTCGRDGGYVKGGDQKMLAERFAAAGNGLERKQP